MLNVCGISLTGDFVLWHFHFMRSACVCRCVYVQAGCYLKGTLWRVAIMLPGVFILFY